MHAVNVVVPVVARYRTMCTPSTWSYLATRAMQSVRHRHATGTPTARRRHQHVQPYTAGTPTTLPRHRHVHATSTSTRTPPPRVHATGDRHATSTRPAHVHVNPRHRTHDVYRIACHAVVPQHVRRPPPRLRTCRDREPCNNTCVVLNSISFGSRAPHVRPSRRVRATNSTESGMVTHPCSNTTARFPPCPRRGPESRGR